ncbi:glutathione S-transferase [Chloropicon primus]|uniref:Glutathione S-transferase n=1 Tax=Chloropicon primus TaxID=1764295 RepID=A0A5B8N0E4_9CHLO|nr:glutathione S-transferase [Chloropicon primus]|eukprot:QDZ25365.1 glutathione S-transferase [Chloropicon primus]
MWKTMTRELAPQDEEGAYARPKDAFLTEEQDVPEGNLVLYTGNACPWCHRVHLAVKVLGLDQVVRTVLLEDDAEKASRGGWIIARRDVKRDPVFMAKDLREVYEGASPSYVGRCTAPLLLDGTQKRIVSNNSTNILRLLNRLAKVHRKEWGAVDLFPTEIKAEIEEMNEYLYSNLCNSVYQAGFSTTQEAHDRAASKVFLCLDDLEGKLAKQEYLMGSQVTAADLMAIPTLARFDAAYAVLFKCSKKRLRDYPNLTRYMRSMFELEGSFEVFDLQAATNSYYQQLFPLNPSGIVPFGPGWEELGIDASSGRTRVAPGSDEFKKRFYIIK